MGVSADCPGLDMAYKLVEYDGRGCLKLSSGKATLPGRKQVYRYEQQDRWTGDEICRMGESRKAAPMLRQVMAKGRRLSSACETLNDMRERARKALAKLPPALLSRQPAPVPYRITMSPALAAYETEVRQQIALANLRR